jgi:hypothetical protein
VREAPTQLKRTARSFLKKLNKYGVRLDNDGDLDLSGVRDDNVRILSGSTPRNSKR